MKKFMKHVTDMWEKAACWIFLLSIGPSFGGCIDTMDTNGFALNLGMSIITILVSFFCLLAVFGTVVVVSYVIKSVRYYSAEE